MKLKKLFSKLKIKRKPNLLLEVKEEKAIDIAITKEDKFYAMTIADYYTISEYSQKIKEIDSYGLDNLLSAACLWNSSKQMVNKGKYYIFRHNDKLYNIFDGDQQIRIGEIEYISQEQKKKVITFNKDSKTIDFFRCMHDKNGSSYNIRYFSTNGEVMGNLDLSKEQFVTDFNLIVESLKTFEDISIMVDLVKLQCIATNIQINTLGEEKCQ